MSFHDKNAAWNILMENKCCLIGDNNLDVIANSNHNDDLDETTFY